MIVVDLKIYEGALNAECPFHLPEQMIVGESLRIGYHQIQFKEQAIANDFEIWTLDKGWIKVLGSQFVGDEEIDENQLTIVK